MTSGRKAIFIALISAVGSLLFGLDIGYIAPILECASFKRDVAHLTDWDDPNSKIPGLSAGLIVSIFSLGAIVASFPFVSTYFLEVLGRRQTIMAATCIFLAGCVLQAQSYSMEQMLVGRFVSGASIGLLSAAVPLYQTEMAPSELRGALVSIYQLMITLGILLAAFLDMELVPFGDGWRMCIWFQSIPAGGLLICMYFLPPSPRWLVTQDRTSEALEVLEDLRGKEEAKSECDDIVRDHRAAVAAGTPDWCELLSVRRVRQLLALGVTMQLLQQLVGMNAFMYFGPRIFRDLGFSENKFQTINNAVNFLSTFPAVLVADKLGRRFLLLWSALGMTCACMIMGTVGTMYILPTEDGGWMSVNSEAGVVMASTIFFFVFNFAYGWGPIVWVYTAEIFPLRYRSQCIGLTTTANWIGNWIVAQFTPMLLEAVGFLTFCIFGGFCCIALAIACWLPETKGVELEQVGHVFDLKFGNTEASKEQKIAQEAPNYGAVIQTCD